MAKNDKPAAKDIDTGGQGSATSQDAVSTTINAEDVKAGTPDLDLADSKTNDSGNVKETSTRGLAVSSNRDGFRRAGLIWNRLPTVVKLSDLTDDQIKQLVDDPSLTIIGVYVPAEDDDQS